MGVPAWAGHARLIVGESEGGSVLRGFKNFLMRGDVIVVAVGLITALAFSTLIKAFTDNVINPIITVAQGGNAPALGWQLGKSGNPATYLNIGAFISAVIYFVLFMAVVYFLIVIPYKRVQARRGVTVFGDPKPAKTCPACLSDDLPVAASKCRYCATDQPPYPR
ncbi:MscL family protein [Microtetraspora malaysiensis]|uniref:large conductance mechanosensitive channel protein MscL n=1 Tax=Microtetraspora malaysiensis TaxID=161358 RepID=UPI003D8E1BEA